MNGLIVFLLLIGLGCTVTFGYRVLNDNAFVSGKYNRTLSRSILVLGVASACFAGLLAIIEALG